VVDAGEGAEKAGTSSVPQPSGGPLSQLVAPPIFVVGHHRSGTTWVFDLLSHPADVAGVFESWLFTSEFGLGGLLHWGLWDPGYVGTVEKVFGRRGGIGQLVTHEEVRNACSQLAQRWLARALQPGHRYLVEKSPDHLYAALAISDVFPDAKFVNVVRDGRDVAVSVDAARSWAPGSIGRRASSVSQVAKRWRDALETSAKVAAHLGPRFFEVTYEQMKAEPLATATALFRFCGIDANEEQVAAALKATEFDKNYEGGDDRFRRAGRVGDWRRTFSLLDRLAFERASGGMLRTRGYERSRWWWAAPMRTGRGAAPD
jgi:sulfotransferase family protein